MKKYRETNKYRVSFKDKKTGKNVIIRFKDKKDADDYSKNIKGYTTKHLGFFKIKKPIKKENNNLSGFNFKPKKFNFKW